MQPEATIPVISPRIRRYNFLTVATTETLRPITAIKRKEIRRLDKPAINPISGGPIKKPRKPIVDTAAMATPGDITVYLPAALYTSGTTEETPKPTRKNPINAGKRKGNKTEINKPVAVSSPLI